MGNDKKNAKMAEKVAELTADLQRTRADFENYRKNVENRVIDSQKLGTKKTILAILPILDDFELALAYAPLEEISKDDSPVSKWAKNTLKLDKTLKKSLSSLNVEQIEAAHGTTFSPEVHQAVQFEEAEGETEIVAEVLRAGWKMNGEVLRPAMVKVSRK
ncbi:MAG: nucleotide exchange factor GrpE [bacterium]|nr:nucleotide exchange factor GrpE [bacterium]